MCCEADPTVECETLVLQVGAPSPVVLPLAFFWWCCNGDVPSIETEIENVENIPGDIAFHSIRPVAITTLKQSDRHYTVTDAKLIPVVRSSDAGRMRRHPLAAGNQEYY